MESWRFSSIRIWALAKVYLNSYCHLYSKCTQSSVFPLHTVLFACLIDWLSQKGNTVPIGEGLCACSWTVGGNGVSLRALLISGLLMSSIRCPIFGYCPAYSCPCGQTATTQNSWAIQCEHCCTHATCATHGEWCSTQLPHCVVFVLNHISMRV